ncbi:MAG: hypothetical protein AB7V50_00560 [Vampirovibrionia bacterium]
MNINSKAVAIGIGCLTAIFLSLPFSQEANAQQVVYYSSGVNPHNTYSSYAMGRRTIAMPTRSTHPYYRTITTDDYYRRYSNVSRNYMRSAYYPSYNTGQCYRNQNSYKPKHRHHHHNNRKSYKHF